MASKKLDEKRTQVFDYVNQNLRYLINFSGVSIYYTSDTERARKEVKNKLLAMTDDEIEAICKRLNDEADYLKLYDWVINGVPKDTPKEYTEDDYTTIKVLKEDLGKIAFVLGRAKIYCDVGSN